MTEEEYKQFLELFAKLDPDGYRMYEILAMIRKHGFGKLTVDIQAGFITKVDQNLGFKIR